MENIAVILDAEENVSNIIMVPENLDDLGVAWKGKNAPKIRKLSPAERSMGVSPGWKLEGQTFADKRPPESTPPVEPGPPTTPTPPK